MAKHGPRFFQKYHEDLLGWGFAAPALILLTVFLLVPFVMAFVFSFTNQRLVPNVNVPTAFIGAQNFVRLFGDPVFLRALFNNFYFTIVVVPVQTSLALLLAMLVNQRLRFVTVFRTIYFSPVAISMVVVSIVWLLLYDASPQGTINRIVHMLTFGQGDAQNWLGNPYWAMPAIMLLSVWQGVGFQMVIYLAGLQDIPHELYEVSDIDGANAWQQFLYVTIPQLRNTSIFVIVTTTIFAFRLFDQVAIMTQGGPFDSTYTMIYHVYEQGFKRGRIGYGSAITVVFFLIVLGISLSQRIFLHEEREVA